MPGLAEQIFKVRPHNFESTALKVFEYQYQNVAVYNEFCNALRKSPGNVSELRHIPFLPISLFKTHRITDNETQEELLFESSTTTGSIPSKHYVASAQLYEQSFNTCFRLFYGEPSEYTILALLPSYLERGNSSLVYMANKLIQQSADTTSGFFMYNQHELNEVLIKLRDNKKKTLLLGVTYALLDFATAYKIYFPNLVVMETGGMKGRGKEITRGEVHQQLNEAFGTTQVHSEYGMTELLSQAYSKQNGLFCCPPWMQVFVRDIHDPFSYVENGKTGALNVIDLANLHSCSFIATDDLGRTDFNGNFEVLGRNDVSEVRGCNLMYQLN